MIKMHRKAKKQIKRIIREEKREFKNSLCPLEKESLDLDISLLKIDLSHLNDCSKGKKVDDIEFYELFGIDTKIMRKKFRYRFNGEELVLI